MSDVEYFGRVVDILQPTLQLAVPLRIFEVSDSAPGIRRSILDAWARDAADKIAHHGDMLMFPSKAAKKHRRECGDIPKGHPDCDCLVGTAQVFNSLAKGIASGSYQPGGINTFGLQFCAEHLPGGKLVGRQDYTQLCRYCLQEEEIVSLGHDSLLKRFWSELDKHVAELQSMLVAGRSSDDTEVAKAQGRADNAALFIALLADPYNPDTSRVRREAMRRWKGYQQQGKVRTGRIQTAKLTTDHL